MNYETSDSNCRFDPDERRDLNKSHRIVVGFSLLTISLYVAHYSVLHAIDILNAVNV